jgi:hypothetical protein
MKTITPPNASLATALKALQRNEILPSGPCRTTLSRDEKDNVSIRVEDDAAVQSRQKLSGKISFVSLFDLSW